MAEITKYHAKYYAYSLTLKHPSHSLQKLTAVLGGARVDLNPHQVEAALFAFNSPLKKGAILADEVGLGWVSQLEAFAIDNHSSKDIKLH